MHVEVQRGGGAIITRNGGSRIVVVPHLSAHGPPGGPIYSAAHPAGVNAMSDVLKISNEGRVRTIRLNRPESMNSLNLELGWGIVAAVEEAAKDDSVWVVALTGEGPVARKTRLTR